MTHTANIPAAWAQLAKSALLGASRTQQATDLGDLLGIALDAPSREPAAALLRDAALLAPMMRTGRMAPGPVAGDIAPLDPAPEESRHAVNERAASHLTTIFGMRNRDTLLGEWLRACGAAGKRVPFRLLPQLLDIGRGLQMAPSICVVIGARGFWLAVRNPNWAYIEREAGGLAGVSGDRDEGAGEWSDLYRACRGGTD